ncbi:MAG: hypothetical protein HFI89_15420 [Lachnospiraceae bacterium]|nr:hypothetical protein [Lachnospiraceae bacterium]
MEVTINIDGQALSVEVTVEVYEYLDRVGHKEKNLAHEKLLAMLDDAFSVITPMQARRVKSYYIRRLDFTRIAREEGVDKSMVSRSVHRGLKYMREFYSLQQME